MSPRQRKAGKKQTGRSGGRNDPCPCGSGRKYKRCCLLKHDVTSQYTSDDRASALAAIERFTMDVLADEDEDAFEDFWETIPDYDGLELADYADAIADDLFHWWFWFDRPLDDGQLVVDCLLAENQALTNRESTYLKLARESCLRLYEVVDTLPGETVTLKDVIDNQQVKVVERTASRTLTRADLVAARVMRGPGSAPAVIEAGMIAFPKLAGRSIVEITREFLHDFNAENPEQPCATFFKQLVPALFRAWAQLVVEPVVPQLQNTDGEELLLTKSHYDLRDAEGLVRTLDARPELDRIEGELSWTWTGRSTQGREISLGRVELQDEQLVLETNSRERGERLRALFEPIAGETVTFRITSHEDVRQRVIENLRSGRRPAEPQDQDLPADVAEELVLTQLGQHYQQWLDEPIPALGDRTPRQAVADGAVADVENLIRGIEGMYERALSAGEPAYDPSWMWHELGLAEPHSPENPPPLAHERWEESLPGWNDTCGKAAWVIRNRPGFDDRSTIASRSDLDDVLEIRRLQKLPQAPPDLTERLRYGVSFELHRRKVFWVDESLAFMLAKTDLEIDGDLLRVPFPAFALVFTDRYTLSFAERLLACDEACPIRGYILRTATVYVLEQKVGDDRMLHLGFALDTRGADPPHLIEQRIPVVAGEPVVVSTQPKVEPVGWEPASRPMPPLAGLLQITLNAILYAVSPASEKIPCQSAPSTRSMPSGDVFASDEVFYLPGPIPISQARQLQRLEHLPSGRKLMTRFMVRGHWRRPAKSWKEQRMRWIRPFWKGPDIAAVIERSYRLEP